MILVLIDILVKFFWFNACSMRKMPGIMSRMPPLPVLLNEELASSIFPCSSQVSHSCSFQILRSSSFLVLCSY